jgi:DNA-binding NarL/FixJ family response regulator
MKTRVALIDDQPRLREAFARKIARFPDCECVGTFATAGEAFAGLPGLRPDVVLVDVSMPGIDGIECLSRLKPIMPDTEFVMLTIHNDADCVFRSFLAGASGYLIKTATDEELQKAIIEVRNGGAPMDSTIARKVIQFLKTRPKAGAAAGAAVVDSTLSPRETEILHLLAEGLLYKEIGLQLGISYGTVNQYLKSVYRKLQVHSRSQAVAAFHRLNA